MDQSIIEPSLKSMMDVSSERWRCKDQHSVFFYTNRTNSQICGYARPEDMIGTTDYDLPCKAAECAALFQKQDQEVLRTGRALQMLDIHPYANDEWRVFSTRKSQLLDAQHQPTGGVLLHDIEITSRKTLELSQLLRSIALQDAPEVQSLVGGNSYVIGQHLNKVALSERESEMLFFLLRVRSLKGLSRVLDVSMHRVEREVESLMYKFGVTGKRELIDTAMQQGYLNQIPATLFKQQLSLILREAQE